MTRPAAKLIALVPPIFALAVVPLCALAAEHPNIDVEKGWKCLFNGKDLSGWHTVTSDNDPVEPDAWVVEDGSLTRKKKGYLRSDKQYGDFILDLEFLLTRQVDQFDELESFSHQTNKQAPCRLVRQEPKFFSLRMAIGDSSSAHQTLALARQGPCRCVILHGTIQPRITKAAKLNGAVNVRLPPINVK